MIKNIKIYIIIFLVIYITVRILNILKLHYNNTLKLYSVFKIENLDFIIVKNYFSLYLDNNSILKNIISQNINNCEKYYTNDNLGEYYHNEHSEITRLISENYNLIFTLNTIINKKMNGFCLLTKKNFICEKISYGFRYNFLYDIIGYHFNCDNDEFIIYLSWEYFTPYMIIYPKRQIIYNISYRYPNINNSEIINYYNNPITINLKSDIKITYCIGIILNSGHYFWNEIFGLMYVIDNNLINNIDEIIIGPYDYLNIGDVIKNKYDIPIKYINKINDKNIILDNNLVINTAKKFINSKLIDLFIKFYEINEKPISDKIHIVFDIRTNRRKCVNCKDNIVHCINEITKLYNNVEFYISGWYNINDDNISDHEKSQHVMFNYIQSKINIKIHSLIGKKLPELIKHINMYDIVIIDDGSGFGFYIKILTNIDTIAYTNNNLSDTFVRQEIFFDKKFNHIQIDKSFITNVNDHMETDYILDQDVILNKILNKILVHKQTRQILNSKSL